MIALSIVCALLTLALGYVLYRYAKLKQYADQADLERLTLAIENSELREQLDFIRFE